MEILGLIPARGGSKGIPRKNLAQVAGRPLLAYTCEAALASKRLTRVVLSTDDVEIARVGRGLGIEVPFMRPAAIASDDTAMIDVIRHCLHELERRESYTPELLVLLQPTSPLRRAEHIDQGVDLLLSSAADTVVSVVPVPHRFNPGSLMSFRNGKLEPLTNGSVITRRQEKPQIYARNGPALLVLRPHRVFEDDNLYSGDCRPFIMDYESSLDVDDVFDLKLANLLLQNKKQTTAFK